MGLLSKLKKGKKTINWDKAYKATPKFYSKPDGHPFGAIALTEGTDTILPKAPQNEYTIDSNDHSVLIRGLSLKELEAINLL